MKNIILLNKNYIDEIISIQNSRFLDCEDDLISKKTFIEYLAKNQIYGYFSKDNKLMGFVFIKIYDSKVRIYQIATKESAKGIGSLLIKHILNLFIKHKKISLEVNTTNSQAIKFYYNHKFEIIKINKKFYNNGDDAYEMEIECLK